MVRRWIAAALIIIGALLVFGYKHRTAAQTSCSPPILEFYDPATGQQVSTLNFGQVPIGQTKTLQIKVVNPPGSPCDVQVIVTTQGFDFIDKATGRLISSLQIPRGE